MDTKINKTSDLKYSRLRGLIVMKYGTISKFAQDLGTSLTNVSNKLNGKCEFTKANIIEWSRMLDIEEKDYGFYFFEL